MFASVSADMQKICAETIEILNIYSGESPITIPLRIHHKNLTVSVNFVTTDTVAYRIVVTYYISVGNSILV